MDTKRFKIVCNGQFKGLILIYDHHPVFRHVRVAVFWPVEPKGELTENDLMLKGSKIITDIFANFMNDARIQQDLIKKSGIVYDNYKIIEFN